MLLNILSDDPKISCKYINRTHCGWTTRENYIRIKLKKIDKIKEKINEEHKKLNPWKPPLYTKKFTLKNTITGEVSSGENIKRFSIEHNLCYKLLISVVSGRRKSHKGWICENPYKKSFSKRIKKNPLILLSFKLKNINTGEIVDGYNMRKFSIDNKLSYLCILRVLKGTQKQHKGWERV